MTEPFYKRQPILAGCLGCLSVSALAGVGFVVFIALLGKGCNDVSSKAYGVDSAYRMVQEVAMDGFGVVMAAGSEGEPRILLRPDSARKVDCDDLQRVYFPHLTGELETVTLHSFSFESGPDGSEQSVPIVCSWSGFPTKDTPLGSASSGAVGE